MRSALGELRCATCSLEAVLFTLLHSRVTGQETCGLQRCAVAVINEEQRAGDTMTDSAGLTGNAAACDGSFDVDLADSAVATRG